jgi:hypothetical protein
MRSKKPPSLLTVFCNGWFLLLLLLLLLLLMPLLLPYWDACLLHPLAAAAHLSQGDACRADALPGEEHQPVHEGIILLLLLLLLL